MYKHTDSDVVVRLSDGAFIPADMANSDYQQYLQWLEAGNVPEPADPALPTIPQEVTRFQALAALHLAGLLEQVEAIMADQATDMLTVLAWKNTQEFKRTSPMVLNMVQALGLSDEQLDNLFITASTIE